MPPPMRAVMVDLPGYDGLAPSRDDPEIRQLCTHHVHCRQSVLIIADLAIIVKLY